MTVSAGRKPAVGFIFVTLTLSIVGFGLLIPVLPKLIVGFSGGDIASGSHAYGWIISVYALMQFIGSPILGSLSDRFGRRPIILIATAGSAIDYMIMAWAPSYAWLFVARMIAGFTGGVLSTANAYIADVTPPEKRAGAFGLLGAAFGIGFVLGPAAGGYLGSIDLHLPFWVAAGCSALNWLYGFFVLPESLKPENRRAFSWSRANPIGALMALKRFPAVLSLAEAYFFLMLAQGMMFSMWALYTDYRYHWTPLQVGLSLMLAGVLSGMVQATLVKRIVPKIGETKAVVIGMSISIFAFTSYGLAPSGGFVYAIIVIAAFAGIAGPAMQSYITKHVPADEQGAVQGVFGGLQSLAGIPAPFIATWSFGWAISSARTVQVPGIAFFEAAACIALALILALRTFRKNAHETIAVTVNANS
ncbi:TCR/Tet family MFS transporter [Oleiharenicola lentus]|uniref:TCR/Tet family MFS transporter n=1 Tax=Oleiharenicola lentus TaxID=2508720 RepID=UPI003F669F09